MHMPVEVNGADPHLKVGSEGRMVVSDQVEPNCDKTVVGNLRKKFS